VLFTSCIPTQDLIYEKDNSEKEMAISFVAKPYRLQTNDVLSINIKAIEISRYFLVLNEEILLNQQLDCILMVYGCDHGNIRMPVLGELNVIGFTLDEISEN
jgi:polysaccharide export outer membrane protein